MAKRQPQTASQRVKGCKKCGRSKKKGRDVALSSFVRGRITAQEYFKLTNQALKRA